MISIHVGRFDYHGRFCKALLSGNDVVMQSCAVLFTVQVQLVGMVIWGSVGRQAGWWPIRPMVPQVVLFTVALLPGTRSVLCFWYVTNLMS